MSDENLKLVFYGLAVLCVIALILRRKAKKKVGPKEP